MRGQRAVENDIGLALMTLNITKLGQLINRWRANFINNRKSGLQFLIKAKIIVRILMLEGQKLIVNSQPLWFLLGFSMKMAMRWLRTQPLIIPLNIQGDFLIIKAKGDCEVN
ncbi:hypothetical protein GTO83_09615 [Lactobacillus sp. 3B(2020)]|nr:hypothetical protein [Lactobacillus sp. 3B(2020)]QLL70754.1 hypothetical protein GTO83_09615 [Lactobacillus sp. 3B(2020)]